MTRSHHSSPTEVCELPTIHIAGNDGVTFKRVPPKSFVRSRKLKTEVFNRPRPARTPPSTFLFLHLYLSNSPEPQLLSLSKGGFETLVRRRIATGSHRLLIHSSKVRSFRGAEAVLAESQNSAALSGCLIGRANRSCQRPLSRNRRIAFLILPAPSSRGS